MKKEFSIVCAVSLNGVIGDRATNSMPWHLPSELRKFKEITIGGSVVMGANTFVSIGRLLPKRQNVVITSGRTVLPDTPHQVCANFEDVLKCKLVPQNFFVIGGASVYEKAIEHGATRLIMTIVHTTAEGNVKFPITGAELLAEKIVLPNGTTYMQTSLSEMQHENGLDFQYVVFEKQADVKKLSNQHYVRHSTVEIAPVLEKIDLQISSKKKLRAEFNGQMVGVSSLRLKTFLLSGTKCACCGLQATHFAVERSRASEIRGEPYHINLWANSESGEILFTHDHIVALSKGGGNNVKNTQTMCSPCNAEKCSLSTEEHLVLRQEKLLN